MELLAASSDPEKLLFERVKKYDGGALESPGPIDHLQNSAPFLLTRNWGVPGLAMKFCSLSVFNLTFDLALHFKPFGRGKGNWYHPFYVYRNRIEESYLRKWMVTDFSDSEFSDEIGIDNAELNKNDEENKKKKEKKRLEKITKLCDAIRKDGYGASIPIKNNHVDWLNSLLKESNFYDEWLKKKKSNKLNDAKIKTLAYETQKYRYSYDEVKIKEIKYSAKEEFNKKTKRLNRLILEKTYPKLCPKSEPEFLMQDINPRESEAPYLIINGMLSNKNKSRNENKKEDTDYYASPFEFTRDFCGSPYTGYVDTRAFDKAVYDVTFEKKFPIRVSVSEKQPLLFSAFSDTKPFPLANAVTASGAALDSASSSVWIKRRIKDAVLKGLNLNTRYETRNFSQTHASWYSWPYDRLIREFILDRLGPTIKSNSIYI